MIYAYSIKSMVLNACVVLESDFKRTWMPKPCPKYPNFFELVRALLPGVCIFKFPLLF